MDAQQLMIALQSPVGLRFGATLQVDSERVTFEIDLKIPKGTECPFRMELSGAENTVMGVVRIEKMLPKRGGEAPRYVARIIEMPPADRAAFDGWRRDLATGGVSRRLERDPEALRDQMSSQMMSGLSETEAKAVLDRMNRRRVSYRKNTEEPIVDFGLADESTSEVKAERGKVREQLRSKQEEHPREAEDTPTSAANFELSESGFAVVDLEAKSEEPDQAEPPVPDIDLSEYEAASEDAEKHSPTWMPPSNIQERTHQQVPVVEAAPPPSPPPSPPLIVVNSNARPIELTVVYLSDESFIEAYKDSLHNSAVTVDHPELTELYQPVNVKLQLASGEAIETIGHMVAQTPQGMAVAMELGPEQRDLLRQSAGE